MRLLKATLFSATLLVAVSSFSQTLMQEKDWTLSLLTSDSAPQGVCVLSTSKKENKTLYTLEIMKRKSTVSPVEIFIRQVGTDINATAMVANFEDQKDILYSFATIASQGGTSTFFHIPRNTELLFQNMINKNQLRGFTQGGSKDYKIKFSYKGFAKVLQAFQTQCMGEAVASNKDFESVFLVDMQKNIYPMSLNAASVGQLRQLLYEAYGIFKNQQQNQSALEQLRAQYLGQIQESEQLTALVGRISQRDLPGLRASLSRSEAEQKKSESDLVSVTSQIPGFQQELRQAQARFQNAQRAIAPFVDEYNSRTTSLSSAQSMLDQSIRRLQQVESSIRAIVQDISSLNSESSQLQYTSNRLREELRRADYELRSAESANRAYNADMEIRKRLDADASYQNALRELTSAKRDLERLDASKRTAQADLQKKQEELRACQGIAGQECAAQTAAVSQAQGVLTTANQAYESQRSIIQSAQSRVDSQRSVVEKEVRRFKDRLESAERDARYRYDRISDSLRQAELRLQIINGSELPSRYRSLQQLESEKPQVQSQISYGQSQVAQLQNELRAFRARVGWDAKKQELDTASELQYEKDEQLSSALGLKSNLESRIVNLKQEQISLKAEIAKQSQILSQSQTRLSALNVQLQPYMSRKLQLEQVASDLQRQMGDKKAQYNNLIPASK